MIFNMIGKGGSGESLIISDTIDSNGGIIRTITGKVVKLQTKTITPTSSTQVVNPDDGYDGFSKITVEAGGGGITPTGNINITQAGTTDVTNYATATVPSASFLSPISVPIETHEITVTEGGEVNSFVEVGGNISPITQNGFVETTDTIFTYNSSSESYYLPTQSSATITPTESSQTAVAKGKWTTGAVTVNAIPSNYVGSGITQRSSSDLTASGATVTVPSGYYSSQATKTVASGTVGTPTATKGTVFNHSVSVTPSVTNTTGYIIGSTKTGTAVTVSASELVSGTKSISANGTSIDVTEYASVDVNVSAPSPTLQSKTHNVSSAGTTTITADSGYDGLSSVEVSVPSADPWLEITTTFSGSGNNRTWTATPKVSVDVAEGDTAGFMANGYEKSGTDPLRFNVVPSNTTITPTESAQTVGGANYIMEGAVTVSAMPTMILPTSTSSSATSGYTNKATISRSTSEQYINIPTGYNSAGGYYTISATPNGTVTTPSSISGTTATVTTGTNTLTLTKTISVTPNVTTVGYISSGTAGNASVSLTANVTTKAAATITPSTSNQTIASGTYLTGAQTIAGDSDLVGGNILSTANIFGVQGTVVVQNYYTGSSAPSSSTGSNGDLYLQS